MQNRILLVEDNPKLHRVVRAYLVDKGLAVSSAFDGEQALALLESEPCHLVLLDILMPKLDGFSVCRRIRKNSDVPIVFLTARSEEEDILFGYDLGADDYITKPFSLPVLYKKVQALLKRGQGHAQPLQFARLAIDLQAHSVTLDGEQLHLPAKVYELLVYLAMNPGRVLTREQILNRVWGYDYFGSDRVVDSHMKKLRAALGEAGGYIQTVFKVGYKFMPPTA